MAATDLPIRFILPVVLSTLFGTASAGSRYADDDPSSCEIIGDASLYGLGLRLGYYFQWVAVILAAYLAPGQIKNIYVSFAAFSLASIACVYGNAANGFFIAVEWHVILLLTFWLGYFAFKFTPVARVLEPMDSSPFLGVLGVIKTGPVRESHFGPHGFLGIVQVVYFFTVPWMYWKGNYVGHKEGCPVHFYVTIILYSWWVDIYDPKWIIAAKVFSILGVLLAAYLLFTSGVILLVAAVRRIIRDDEPDNPSKCLRATYTLSQLFCGAWIIGMVEATVKTNHVDLSKGTLDSSGQLIPLLIGAMSLLMVFVDFLRHTASAFPRPAIFDKYIKSVSATVDRIERGLQRKNRKVDDRPTEDGPTLELGTLLELGGPMLSEVIDNALPSSITPLDETSPQATPEATDPAEATIHSKHAAGQTVSRRAKSPHSGFR